MLRSVHVHVVLHGDVVGYSRKLPVAPSPSRPWESAGHARGLKSKHRSQRGRFIATTRNRVRSIIRRASVASSQSETDIDAMASQISFSNLPVRQKPGSKPGITADEQRQIIKEEEVDEKKHTPLLIPDDGLDDLDASGEIIDNGDEMYGGGPLPKSPFTVEMEAFFQKPDEEFNAWFAGRSVEPEVQQTTQQVPKLEDVVDDDRDKRPDTRPSLPIATSLQAPSESMFVPEDHCLEDAHEPCLRMGLFNGDRCGTVCFEGPMRTHPYQHMLACGHIVRTQDVVTCGSNCKQSRNFDRKMEGRVIQCSEPQCLRREKVFVPMKNPARKVPSKPGHVWGVDKKIDQIYKSRTTQGFSDMLSGGLAAHGRTLRHTRKSNAFPASTSGMTGEEHEIQDLAELRLAEQLEAAKRESSFLPVMPENLPGREAANLHMDVNAGIFGKATKPRRARKDKGSIGSVLGTASPVSASLASAGPPTKELRNLNIDGRPALGGMMATQNALDFNVHNAQEMLRPAQHPHSYTQGDIRNGQNFSMPETQYSEMIQAENHVIVETLDTGDTRRLKYDGRHDRENLEDDSADVDRVDTGEFEIEEAHCACQSAVDGAMLPCARCGDMFHPSCIGKGRYAEEVYQGEDRLNYLFSEAEEMRQDEEMFFCLDCDMKSSVATQMLGNQTRENRGVLLGLRKRGADQMLESKRELARTAPERQRYFELFGEEYDSDAFGDSAKKGMGKRRKLAKQD
ncbi:hypothetical protein LTR08_002683 [Meristemomyces frigidus]|nr:hypothetical protein LTR08_002683 [Meristemomyces frigidus]